MNKTQNKMAMKVNFSFPSPGADSALPNANTEFNQNPFSSLVVKHVNLKTLSQTSLFIS
jgi:hypothetical protein